MKTAILSASLICCVAFPILAASPNDAFRALEVIDDLRHGSGKVGNFQALIIGINDYHDPEIPDLKTPINDARGMADVLEKRYRFTVTMLLNEEATRKGIYNALRTLSVQAQENDSVLIYYAGHGDIDRQYNDGWWIPFDARPGDPTTYFDNVQVQKAMRSMKARHVLLLSDSCYSGTLFGLGRDMPPIIDNKYYLNLYNEKSRWGMTSGNKTPVADDGTAGHSVFAYQLIKELRKNENPYMTTQEIYTRIAPIVSNNAEQTPICRPIKNTGDQGGEFVFIASSGTVIERPSKNGATLSVESNVVGARISINGRRVGTTPLSEFPVAGGKVHLILVEKEGYDAYQKVVYIEEGRSLAFNVFMDPVASRKGRLYIDVQPAGAQIRILNIGSVFYPGMELEAGTYTVEVTAKGYETETQEVVLNAGEDKYLDIRLKKALATWIGQRVRNSLGMEFVYIPAGSFMMGSPKGEFGRENNENQHPVTLTSGFYLQSTEVTQRQWKVVMGNNPALYQKCGEDCPVEQVSWTDVQEFIKRLNQLEGDNRYRLPTEAEWEYACRAGSMTRFSYGNDDERLSEYAWYLDNSEQKTHPVAQKTPNAWGLYDMHGNVWEWCQDWFGAYPSGSVTDPQGPLWSSYRVFRGGSWIIISRYCRSAIRFRFAPELRYSSLGVRLARTP